MEQMQKNQMNTENKKIREILERERQELKMANGRIELLKMKIEAIDQVKERIIYFMNVPIMQKVENSNIIAANIMKKMKVKIYKSNFGAQRISKEIMPQLYYVWKLQRKLK
ncbi:hypothetical protein HHI36_008167 [Cryptolaemus montrouzieri]|uniref:Uncharacterized protein n=1 Tax=Cryptolaemus montrouzieri TaxID=559131 RepID=A0ABD2MRR3_9CUCU